MKRRVRGNWLNLAAILLIWAGIVIAFIGHDTLRWAPPPVPPAWAAAVRPPPPGHDALAGHPGAAPPTGSSPVSLDIPSIDVHAKIIALGLNRDGTLTVPPLSHPYLTSWYDKGPVPGQPGAAAILGHVDAASVGPAVFYHLGKLRPGARIYVRLRDRLTVVFETYSVALYDKTKFPTARVFGHTSWPTLRLITCGGLYDRQTGHYLGNVVAFASYIGSYR